MGSRTFGNIIFEILFFNLVSRQNEGAEKRIINQKYFEREETESLIGTYTYGKMLASLTQSQTRQQMPSGKISTSLGFVVKFKKYI